MRMVVKTLKRLVVATKCIDMNTMEILDKEFVLAIHGKNVPDYAKIAKAINATIDGSIKLVKIEDAKIETKKFGMNEEDFIKNATVIE